MKDKQPKKGTKLQKNLGVSDAEMSRAVATKHTIDVNKRKITDKINKEEPKMTD